MIQSDADDPMVPLFEQYSVSQIAAALVKQYSLGMDRAHALVCTFKFGTFCAHLTTGTIPNVKAALTDTSLPSVTPDMIESFTLYWEHINRSSESHYYQRGKLMRSPTLRDDGDMADDCYREPTYSGPCQGDGCSKKLLHKIKYRGKLLCDDCRRATLPKGFGYHRNTCECRLCGQVRSRRKTLTYTHRADQTPGQIRKHKYTGKRRGD